MFTNCALAYVPSGGLKVGAATCCEVGGVGQLVSARLMIPKMRPKSKIIVLLDISPYLLGCGRGRSYTGVKLFFATRCHHTSPLFKCQDFSSLIASPSSVVFGDLAIDAHQQLSRWEEGSRAVVVLPALTRPLPASSTAKYQMGLHPPFSGGQNFMPFSF
jgi:hypothetical protein